MKDEILEMETYNPHAEEDKIRWIFPDTENLPEVLNFEGIVQRRGNTGTMIPCFKFEGNWYLSQWSKPVVIVAIKKGDPCKVYKNKDGKIEVLRLN